MDSEQLSALFLAETGQEIRCSITSLSFSFHFSGIEDRNGVFLTLELKGLRRHQVSLEFGSYSRPVRDLIREAKDSKRRLADSLSQDAFNSENVTKVADKPFSEICIEAKPKVELLTRSNIDNYAGDEEVLRSVRTLIMPLMLSLAELIGYDEEQDHSTPGEEEGEEYLRHSIARERNPRNRKMCILLHGAQCKVCGFDGTDKYGSGFELVEVHHIEPLSSFEGGKVFDPAEDLVPLCPNCHRAIHKRSPPYTLDELRALMALD